MKVHLRKVTFISGVTVSYPACVSDPFTKGRVLKKNKFIELTKKVGHSHSACKRCINILNK